MMDGMAHELHQMYQAYRAAGGTAKKLIGSGGGLRNNRFLRESFSRAFDSEITLSDGREEAACGAALYAAD